MTQKDEEFVRYVINLAADNVLKHGNGPFAAIVVKDGKIIGEGNNSVTNNCDPTAHAEVVAIRNACKHLKFHQLDDCVLYTSCEPCPMCFGAIYWARPDRVVYAATKKDAAEAGFDDAFIYEELNVSQSERKIEFTEINIPEKLLPFVKWAEKPDKILY